MEVVPCANFGEIYGPSNRRRSVRSWSPLKLYDIAAISIGTPLYNAIPPSGSMSCVLVR